MFSHIVLASDGSEIALKAAHTAVEIARRFDARILLVTVFNPATVPVPFVGVAEAYPAAETSVGAYADTTQTEIENVTGRILDEGKVCWRAQREIGHPVDRIVAVAEDVKAELIVIGSRGLSEWRSFLLGSTSHGVLHHAHCPVLVVR